MSAGLSIRDAQGRPIGLHKEISRDEQYAYYTVERRPEVVAKVALDPLEPRQAERLSALVAARTGALEDVSTWPTATLHDATGQPVGFLMLRVDRQDDRQLREVYAPARMTPRSWPERIQVAARLAQAFSVLHAAGQVMGDVNGRHILVSPRGNIRFTEVDGYQVRTAAQVIPSVPSLPEFTPPELQGRGHLLEHTANHDLFGLAVLVFRLVMDGQHPYSGVPVARPMPSPGEAIAADLFAYSRTPRPGVKRPTGTPALDTLSPAVQGLFERAFSPQHENRPSASEWRAALVDMQSSLENCDQDSSHLRVRGQPCPQCELKREQQAVSALPGDVMTELKSNTERLWQQVQAVRPPDKPANTSAPELPNTPSLPPLPLNLPSAPRSLIGANVLEGLLRWLMRLLVIALIFFVVYQLQKSVLAAVIEIGIVLLILTLGRRFSVDWDGIITNFQNWEGRTLERVIPTNSRVQAYYAAIEERRKEHRNAFKDLKQQYDSLEGQYRDQNAFARYQAEMTKLDQRRRRLLQQETQVDSVQALLTEYRQNALAEYLKQQSLQSGIVPELTSRLALHLSTMGIRRASDVQREKLKVVRPELASELLTWRDDLTHFFQFDEASIPQARLSEARQKQQMGQRAEFRQFEQDARRFLNTDWHSQEQEFLGQLTDLKAQAKQRQKVLKTLDELAAK